ncbi:MAG: hypothetical protein GXO27_07230 [Chlorobi bacterium]|nr:hypothetical protein [Chlorobiota bacterium]
MNSVPKRTELAARLLAGGLILFYVTTGLYKFLVRTGISEIRFGPFIKLIYEIFILLYIFRYIDRVKIQILGGIALLFLDFLIGQYFLHKAAGGEDMHFVENLLLFFRYVFVFLAFAVAYDLIRYRYFPPYLEKTFRGIFWVNGVFIFGGAAGLFPWAASYDNAWRFGFNGLFFSINDSSFLYIMGLTYLYYKRFYLGEKDRLFWWVLFSTALLGTKTAYGFLILLFLFHAYRRLRRFNFKILLAATLTLLAAVYGVFHRVIDNFFADTVRYFRFLYEEYGFWYMVTSGRSSYFAAKLLPLFEKWSWPNYLFGGMVMGKYNVEMDFVDLFLMFGIAGMILYLSMFNQLVRFLRLPKDLKIFFLIIVMGLAFVSGHFFTSDLVGLFFVTLIVLTQAQSEKYGPSKHT